MDCMEAIDELVPLTADDLKMLEAKKTTNYFGCGVILIIFFLVTVLLAYVFFIRSYLFLSVSAVVSIIFLFAGVMLMRAGSVDDKKVVLDIQEGKKRRIVAPIESKDIIEVGQKGSVFPRRLSRQIADSYAPVNLKYSMMVQGLKFPLSETQYLSGFRKGDFVEFFIAPNSQIILSVPEEVAK